MGPHWLWKPILGSDLVEFLLIFQHSIIQNVVCGEPGGPYEVAAAQCNVILRTNIDDMKQCSNGAAFDGSSLPLEASFWIRYVVKFLLICQHIASVKMCCMVSQVDHEVAAAQSNVILRTNIDDMKQCSSI
jgi:hypothetical protein